MPQLRGADPELPDRKLIHVDLLHGQLRRERVERHRKHGRVHLLAQDRLERRRPLPRAPNAYAVAGGEERLEVRKPLYVIPVSVREQDFDFRRAVLFRDQLEPERPNAGARVEHDELAFRGFDRHTWRIAAIARSTVARSWNAAPGSPEGDGVGIALGHAVD